MSVFIYSEIFCLLSILVQCPFLEVLVEAGSPPLPSKQGSSINKKAAPHWTIMAKNKLLSQDLSSCFHSFNANYVMRCFGVCTWLYAGVSVYVSISKSTCVLFYVLYLVSEYWLCLGASVCFTPQSQHHSASLSGTLVESVWLCVPVCCLLSIYCVSHWVLHQTAFGSAKVTQSSVSKIVSRQIHANIPPIHKATQTHTNTTIFTQTEAQQTKTKQISH